MAPVVDIVALEAEMRWLSDLISHRMHLLTAPGQGDHAVPKAPRNGAFAGVPPAARIVLGLALAPQLAPHVLDLLQLRNPMTEHPFSDVGLTAAGSPSAGTAAFLLGGDVAARLSVAKALQQPPLTPWIKTEGPPLSAALTVTDIGYEALTGGMIRMHQDAPAQTLSTALTWDDLILPEATLAQVGHILHWTAHGTSVANDPDFGAKLPKGYAALFHGPPGCGKTLTASLVGQRAGRMVYRVDLSQTVSKWIGETTKNLSRLFDLADRQDAILFFDEADALFARRTEVQSANDRFANQEVAYILQRIETCTGLVILATNLRATIDTAFTRRLQSVIAFTLPDAALRLKLWRGLFRDPARLAPDVDIVQLSRTCELPGGGIVNVVRHAALCAAAQGRAQISKADIDSGIALEHIKIGRLTRSPA